MKHITLIAVCLLLFCSISIAQYKINKTKYDYRTYTHEVGDPYNTGVAGVASFLLPGLGQMISGEGGRGAAFLVGYTGCWVLYAVGSVQAANAMEEDDLSGEEYQGEGLGLMLIGLGGAIAVNIWSIVDAVRVAKVNNLAWRDRNTTGYKIQIQPYIGTLKNGYLNISEVGLSVKLNF